jgi:hypothetical protein
VNLVFIFKALSFGLGGHCFVQFTAVKGTGEEVLDVCGFHDFLPVVCITILRDKKCCALFFLREKEGEAEAPMVDGACLHFDKLIKVAASGTAKATPATSRKRSRAD